MDLAGFGLQTGESHTPRGVLWLTIQEGRDEVMFVSYDHKINNDYVRSWKLRLGNSV